MCRNTTQSQMAQIPMNHTVTVSGCRWPRPKTSGVVYTSVPNMTGNLQRHFSSIIQNFFTISEGGKHIASVAFAVMAEFGQTAFGPNQIWPDQIWPKTPELGKQKRIWPAASCDRIWPESVFYFGQFWPDVFAFVGCVPLFCGCCCASFLGVFLMGGFQMCVCSRICAWTGPPQISFFLLSLGIFSWSCGRG